MTTRTFAPWVEPVAAETLSGAEELLEFARSQPAAFWDRPSPLAGWTYKDMLGHLAGDTGKVSSSAMRAAVTGRPFENPPDFADGGDALNANDVADRRSRSVEELIAEIAHDRQEWADLMRQLRDADEDARWDGFPLTLGQYLRICAPHDREHLAELRTALEGNK
ncbi:MAG: DinB family protein [Dehalococcoidia bacterium]